MTPDGYLSFLLACIALALVPGQDTLLTIRCAARGHRSGVVYASAACLGIVIWAALALTGVAAVLQTSPAALTAVTALGGSYLCFLGLRLIVPAAGRLLRRTGGGTAPHASGTPAGLRGTTVFGTGMISSLTNAKTGIFFLALLPGFIPLEPGAADYVLLIISPAAAVFAVLLATIVFAAQIGRFLSDSRRSAVADLGFGLVFCVLGVTVILH